MFFYIEPEVAGGLGPETVLDSSVHPPIVSKLEFRFEGWLGDELLETFPCFIVTGRVKKHICYANLTGVEFRSLSIIFSEDFVELHPGLAIPDFFWMHVMGSPGRDDFGIADDLRLVISNDAKSILNTYGFKHADVERFS
jgi:hypothetical protein